MRKYVTLGDVCEKGSSNIAQKDIENSNGTYAIYGASGYIKDVNFYHQDKPYIAVVKDGAGIGRTMLLPEKTSVIGTLQYLIPNDSISVKYLYYAVTYMNLSKYFTGATIPHIYFKDYQKELLPLPPMEKQLEIAGNLEKIDAMIGLCNSIMEKMDVLVKSRFIEMFGGLPDKNFATLSNVAHITGGLTKNSKRKTMEIKMPYLRVANVLFNELKLDEIMEIGVMPQEIDKVLLQSGDLLFVEGNGSIEQIGRVAIWDGSINPCLHQNHLIKARFDQNQILPEYALFYFMSQEGRRQIESKSVSTSGLNTLSVKKIESLLLPIVPLRLQNDFAAFVREIDKSKLVCSHIVLYIEILLRKERIL